MTTKQVRTSTRVPDKVMQEPVASTAPGKKAAKKTAGRSRRKIAILPVAPTPIL